MSVMFVGSGGCSCAPAATLVCDSISATKTKCGWDEFSSPSSPPKKYLTRTLSGSLTVNYYGPFDTTCTGGITSSETWTASGTCTYSRPACSLSSSGQITTSTLGTCTQCDVNNSASCGMLFSSPQLGDSSTATTYTRTGDNVCTNGGSFYSHLSGALVVTLSSEYTTSQLISDVEAALPSYPGTWAGTCSAYRDLSTDELTYTIRRFKYKFTLPTLTGFGGYKITWDEGATAKSYIWDGSATETPVYGPISEPGTNGTIAISNVAYSLLCS